MATPLELVEEIVGVRNQGPKLLEFFFRNFVLLYVWPAAKPRDLAASRRTELYSQDAVLQFLLVAVNLPVKN